MKNLLIVFFWIIKTANSFAQDPFSVYNDVKPKGKIDSVIIISGNADGTHIYVYNKRRQLTEVTWYRDEIVPEVIGQHVRDTIKTEFYYGANQHLISSVMIFNGGKRNSARYEYLPNKYGYAIRVIDPRDSDSLMVYEMRFNHFGQITQSGYFALNDLEQQSRGNFSYKYDEKGNMAEKAAYYNLATAPFKLFYKYNSDGDMTAQNREDATDERNSTYSYTKYDKMHNWTERKFLNTGGFQHRSYRRITYYK